MTKKPCILIADDDRFLREALAARLVQGGFEVASAANASAAIELFQKKRPDAAVLDVQMPGDDGFSVCEHIRKTGSAIPVVFLTGSTDGVIRNHLPSLTSTVGANHFLTKPFDGRLIAALLREAITPVAAT